MPENLVKRGNIWHFRMQVNGRPILKSTGFSDEKSAIRRAAEFKAAILAGKAGWRAPAPTVGEWWAVYQRTYTKRKRDPQRDVSAMATFLKRHSTTPLDAITRSDCIAFLNERGAMVAQGTVGREMAFLKCFFNRAIDEHHLEQNPWKGVKRPQEVARTRVLTREEQSRLLAVLSPYYQRMVLVVLGTGLRASELRALTPLHITPKGIQVKNGKGGKDRLVPLREDVRTLLDEQIPNAKGYYFPLKSSAVWETLQQACEAADIPPISLHDLRRTFATRCAVAGMPPKVLQGILGHSSINVTMKHYTHISQDDAQAALDKIPLGIDTTFDTGERRKREKTGERMSAPEAA